jgi:hypothetical protein
MESHSSQIRNCPRCNYRSLEKLQTYAHCMNCFYVDDYAESHEVDVLNFIQKLVQEGASRCTISKLVTK